MELTKLWLGIMNLPTCLSAHFPHRPFNLRSTTQEQGFGLVGINSSMNEGAATASGRHSD
jgi:hypothetical protein